MFIHIVHVVVLLAFKLDIAGASLINSRLHGAELLGSTHDVHTQHLRTHKVVPSLKSVRKVDWERFKDAHHSISPGHTAPHQASASRKVEFVFVRKGPEGVTRTQVHHHIHNRLQFAKPAAAGTSELSSQGSRAFDNETQQQWADPMELVSTGLHSRFTKEQMMHVPLEAGTSIWSDAELADWLSLAVCILVMWGADRLVIQHFQGGLLMHVGLIIFWLMCAAAYAWLLATMHGTGPALEFGSGILLEAMFEIDNLLVWHCILLGYDTPPALIRKALFFCLPLVVVIRLGLYCAIGTLLSIFQWASYLFGALLVLGALNMLWEIRQDATSTCEIRPPESAPSEAAQAQNVHRRFISDVLHRIWGDRFADRYDLEGHKFFIQDSEGKTCFTRLVVVVMVLEFVTPFLDIDNTSAKLSIMSNQFLAFSSSAFCVFAVREAYFLLCELVRLCEYLKYGVCFALLTSGVMLCMGSRCTVPRAVVFQADLVIFGLCVGASTIGFLSGRYAHKDGAEELLPNDKAEETVEKYEEVQGTSAEDGVENQEEKAPESTP